jgi:exopolysaccharide biosynthesis polyprenyl glycosylphosphotransferase
MGPFLPGDTPATNPTRERIAPQAPAAARVQRRHVSLRASERYLVLGLLDTLLINAALVLAVSLATDFKTSVDSLVAYNKWFITLAIAWLGCATFFDCYNLARAASTTATVRNATLAIIATVIVYILIPYLTPPLISRGMWFYFAGFALVLVLGWRVIYAQLFSQPWFEQRALIVGAGSAGIALTSAMKTTPRKATNPFRGTGYQVMGFIDDDVRLHGQAIEGLRVLGDNLALVRLCERLHVNEIILAITNAQTISDEMMQALLLCREMGLRVVTMATVYERLTGRVPIDYVGRDLYMVLPMNDSAVERAFLVGKRLVDVCTALVGLAMMLIAALPIAIANYFTARGPLFYKQRRVGQGGRIFSMYKFRSMRPDAEYGTGAVWARKGDDRITPAGRVMRRTRIDELPQFINVLKGDMSLIGPRPERPEFVNALSLMIPYYRARHAVKPGITGWAQIKFGYGSTHQDARIKLEHDLYYVKHASPMLDIIIFLQTFPVMVLGRGT